MRYDKGQKEKTKEQILQASTAQFLKNGYHAVGVASLMSEAGLTNGAFYNHFKSKEDLFRQCVIRSLENIRKLMIMNAEKENGGLDAIFHDYLGEAHLNTPERGCAAASLTPEIGRLGEHVRQAFDIECQKIVDVLYGQLPDNLPEEERRQIAHSLFSLMTGTLQLARAARDPETAAEILKSGIDGCRRLSRV